MRSEPNTNLADQFSSEKLLLHKVHKAESILAPNWHKMRTPIAFAVSITNYAPYAWAQR